MQKFKSFYMTLLESTKNDPKQILNTIIDDLKELGFSLDSKENTESACKAWMADGSWKSVVEYAKKNQMKRFKGDSYEQWFNDKVQISRDLSEPDEGICIAAYKPGAGGDAFRLGKDVDESNEL